MTEYGYARVSTAEQDLHDQIEKLEQRGVTPDHIYAEKITGTKMDRPQWNKLTSKLIKGDTLIITKLDRLARTMLGALNAIEELRSKGVAIEVLNGNHNVVMDDSPMGKMTTNMLLMFAEFERDMIVKRTQEGKAYAKKHNPNYTEGRPKRKMTDRYWKVFHYSMNHTLKETADMCGISVPTVSRIKRQVREQYPEKYKEALDNANKAK